MSNVNDLKASNGLLIKPKQDTEEARLAKIREQQKRERKERLYSSGSKSH